MSDEQRAEIRCRNDYLRSIPFDTHGPGIHGDNCPPCGMVRGIGDVTALLAALDDAQKQPADTSVQWGVQSEHGDDAFPARTREVAEEMAAQYSRLREPGCLPTPWYVVRRVRTDWERVDVAQQPEDGG
jgi:hypothetical protein